MNKKRYAALLWTGSEKFDKMDCKGIETVRRDNCGLVRTMVDTCLKTILMRRDPQAAADYVRGVIRDLLMNRVDISELIITKALHKTEEESKSAQAHVVLAAKMRERDPNTAPVLGDRVPYVIVKGVKGAKAFEKAEDPIYVLENNIPIDVQHYLDHHLAQPILRLFEAIMDRPQSLLSGDHTRQISMATPTTGGLMKFVSVTLTCLGCRTPLRAGQTGAVCEHCRKDEAELCRRALDGVSAMQSQFARLWTQCQRCQGSLHQEVLCTSRDCPIFYRRRKAHKDLLDAQRSLERFASW
jgi:DNA polymerase delta subunit 1